MEEHKSVKKQGLLVVTVISIWRIVKNNGWLIFSRKMLMKKKLKNTSAFFVFLRAFSVSAASWPGMLSAWGYLRGHVTLRAASPQHSRKTGAFGSAEGTENRCLSTMFTLSMSDRLPIGTFRPRA
ncbi:MAG: hypothetical protein ACOX9E_05275 [Lentisphaeria bacterium]